MNFVGRRGRFAAVVAIGPLAIAAGLCCATPTAAAEPGCPVPAAQRIQGVGAIIESAAIDSRGRLYVGNLAGKSVQRIDYPGAAPQVVATIVASGNVSGVAIGGNDDLYAGGSNTVDAPAGDVLLPGSLTVFDGASGAIKRTFSKLSAANGIGVAPDGTAFVTNDLATKIGRANPDGSVNSQWARLPSANGGAVSPDGRWLYVSRSFVAPGVSRISTADPSVIENVWTAPLQYRISAPDGLALTPTGGVVVPMNATGQIVRIEGGRTCTLAYGLLTSTQVVYGRGNDGFSAGRLFRVGFDGQVWEITSART